MNCKTMQNKLSLFIDGELGENEKLEISSHIAGCPACKEELAALEEQKNILIKQAIMLKPSSGLRAAFWSKARTEETAKSGIFFPVFRWLPVPIGASFFLVFFSVFSLVSPAIYGGSVSKAAGEAFSNYSARSVFGPANFSKFCDKCINNLCECCHGKPGAKCVCKGR